MQISSCTIVALSCVSLILPALAHNVMSLGFALEVPIKSCRTSNTITKITDWVNSTTQVSSNVILGMSITEITSTTTITLTTIVTVTVSTASTANTARTANTAMVTRLF